jgi:hypothetical protein
MTWRRSGRTVPRSSIDNNQPNDQYKQQDRERVCTGKHHPENQCAQESAARCKPKAASPRRRRPSRAGTATAPALQPPPRFPTSVAQGSLQSPNSRPIAGLPHTESEFAAGAQLTARQEHRRRHVLVLTATKSSSEHAAIVRREPDRRYRAWRSGRMTASPICDRGPRVPRGLPQRGS